MQNIHAGKQCHCNVNTLLICNRSLFLQPGSFLRFVLLLLVFKNVLLSCLTSQEVWSEEFIMPSVRIAWCEASRLKAGWKIILQYIVSWKNNATISLSISLTHSFFSPQFFSLSLSLEFCWFYSCHAVLQTRSRDAS